MVKGGDTIDNLLSIAQENFGIPKKSIKLLRHGVPLDPQHTVAQAGLDDYDVIVVGVRMLGGLSFPLCDSERGYCFAS